MMWNINHLRSQICCNKINRILFNKIKRNCETISINSQDDNVEYYQKVALHKPGKNYANENYIVTKNTDRLLREHLKRTGGQVRTRFTPEPNELLRINHARDMNINFGFAKERNGLCFLRCDDSNPERKDDIFVKEILEMVEWLGFEAHKITYASDYFQQLYEYAEKLIEKKFAYVYHNRYTEFWLEEDFSTWYDRPTSESLKDFRDMKNGKYKEGEAFLRLKMPTEDDPVAYEIKYTPHYRTKDKWCIYPTFDYAHSLCDSIEDITHSFCSSEFVMSQSVYYFVCNSLDLYCPVQTEYGSLNFLHTVESKYQINPLIEAGVVQGLDDPRLYTLAALRRKGFPPEAILEYCSEFGLETDEEYCYICYIMDFAHKHLFNSAPRIMAVFEPLKVVITNYPYEENKTFEVPNVKHDPSKGSHTVSFDKEIWIERSDFQKVGEKGFRRLTVNQGVGLLQINQVIFLKEIVYKSDGEIDYLEVMCCPLQEVKKMPKGYIHWVAKPVTAEARIHRLLFKSERPDEEIFIDRILSDIMPDTLETSEILIGESSLNNFVPFQRFQFERVGYFSIDLDTQPNRLVINKIIGLSRYKEFRSFSDMKRVLS